MKKTGIYAMTAAAVLAMTGAVPFSAFAATHTYQVRGGNMIVAGMNGCNSNGTIDQVLGQLGALGCGQNSGGNCLSGLLGQICSQGNCNFAGGSSGCNSGGNSGTGSGTPGLPDTGTPMNPGTPSTPGDSVTADSFAEQVVSLVNAERAKAGLSPLTVNNGAAQAAMTRAKEITSSFSHTRPSGKSFSTALTEAGVSFRSAGENIAYGQRSAEEVMNGWMNSSGHRANILNGSFTQIGVAHYQDASGTDYWVQLFLN